MEDWFTCPECGVMAPHHQAGMCFDCWQEIKVNWDLEDDSPEELFEDQDEAYSRFESACRKAFK